MKNKKIIQGLGVRFGTGCLTVAMLFGIPAIFPDAAYATEELPHNSAKESNFGRLNETEINKMSHSERLTLQKQFIYNIMYSKSNDEVSEIVNSKNYMDIKKLIGADIVVTANSFLQLRDNFNMGHYNTSVLKVNLFDTDNLNSALISGFNFALFNNGSSNFVFDIDEAWSLKKDPATKKATESLLDYIKNTQDCENDKEVYILKELKNIKKSMAQSGIIKKGEYFYLFIDGMEKAYQVCISRRVAETVLEKYRAKTESEIGSKKVEQSAEVTTKANVDGAFAGISAKVSSSEGATENSFYTLGIGGGMSFCIGADFFSMLSAKFGACTDATYTEIFYSLEQVLDSDFPTSSAVTQIPVAKSLLKRKDMQKKEKELLSVFKISVEGFLNAAGIIPISVPVEWPEITRVQSKQTEKTVSISIEAAAEAFSGLNMLVSATQEKTEHISKRMYIDLINEDCSIADGMDIKDILAFLKSSNSSIFLKLQSVINKELAEDQTGYVLPQLVTTVLGDIREYNSVLSILCNKNATGRETAKAKKTKHDIEKRWISGIKTSRNKGRFAVLKSAIAVAVILRDKAKSEREIGYFRQLYEEIGRLAKLQDFSNQKSSRSAKVATKRYTRKSLVNGKASVAVPLVGEGSINVTYLTSEGPVYCDNSKDIIMKIKLPTVVDGVAGMKTARALINTFVQKNICQPDIGDAFLITDSSLKDYLKFSSTAIPSALNALTVTGYFTMVAGITKISKSDTTKPILPLPGQNRVIIKDKDEWKLKFTQQIFSTDSNIKVEIPGISSVKLSNSWGKVKTKIAPNTLSFIGNKYNALRQGMMDENEQLENTLWKSFKKGQKNRLLKLFKKITGSNSNARYELQSMYNDIIANILALPSCAKKMSQQADCNDIFKEFVDVCSELLKYEKPKNEPEFKKAQELLDKILELNYTYHFVPETKAAHQL